MTGHCEVSSTEIKACRCIGSLGWIAMRSSLVEATSRTGETTRSWKRSMIINDQIAKCCEMTELLRVR